MGASQEGRNPIALQQQQQQQAKQASMQVSQTFPDRDYMSGIAPFHRCQATALHPGWYVQEKGEGISPLDPGTSTADVVWPTSLLPRGTCLKQHTAHACTLLISRAVLSYVMPCVSCRWRCDVGKPECDVTFEGHVDWVNDVLLYQDRLVTCSSDRAVKIWQAGEEGEYALCSDGGY